MKEVLKAYKNAPVHQISSYCVPIKVDGKIHGRLRPITTETIHNQVELQMLTDWRTASGEWFTTQFPATVDGTREWIRNLILQADDRILFFIDDEELNPIGQIGLLHYDEEKKQCEFDNLLRGSKGKFRINIIYALLTLGEWSINTLDMQTGYLNVLADNLRAIHIYEKIGFQEVERVPLIKVIDGDVTRWVPAIDQPDEEAERHLVTMMLNTEVYLKMYKQTP